MAITNITEALDALKTLAEGLPAAVTVDDTLSVEGAAADAKAVGEAIVDIGELVNTHTNQINEIGIKHMGNYSNPHNVTAAQVTTASGKTVEEALEIPYFDLVAMGLTNLDFTNSTTISISAENRQAIFEAGSRGEVAFNVSVDGTNVRLVATCLISPESAIFSWAINMAMLTISVYMDNTLELFYDMPTFRPLPHSQHAGTITEGTFAGQVVANSTAQTPATMLLRNSKLVTTETNPTNNGEIVWQYG